MDQNKTNSTLTKDDINRYSRQLILPEIGVSGQRKLKDASVLIVGAGGLGCPVALYLAAAGIGKIGIIDYDAVEKNNLHRQVVHTEAKIGISKAKSISESLLALNSSISCIPYHCQLKSGNALQITRQYDVVVDATDNVATRYLINDACVLAKRPLVSGSALRFEGQLTVYNHNGGPCYRCLFPDPPPPEAVTNCSDGGVLGSVPGMIGCLQSLEVIKLIVGLEVSYSQKMFIFDGLSGVPRVVKLRSRQKNCCVCGDNPTLTQLIDYEQFCGVPATDKEREVNLLSDSDRISCQEYNEKYKNDANHILIDVRPSIELEICKLPNSINIPISDLSKDVAIEKLKTLFENNLLKSDVRPYPIFVVCRRGNDSQIAVDQLKRQLSDQRIKLRDLSGGLNRWASEVDIDFPIY